MYRTCISLTVAVLLAFASSAVGQLGPDGWWSETIAVNSDPRGSATIDGGTYTITGDGHDIWDAADDFHYLYKELVGDGSMTCRVVSIGSGSNTWAKGGVMIRDNNTRGSADAYCVITSNSDGTAGNGAGFQWRDSQGAGAAWDGAGPSQVVAPPYWARLEREGNVFRGYLSPDGTTWTQLQGDHTVVMTDPVLIGLCVTSHTTGELRTFVFDNVSWTGDVRDRPPQMKAWNPDPPDGTVGWNSPLLQWTKGETGFFNDVYFGEDPENLALVSSRVPFDLYFHPMPLEPGTTYYWRVDQVEVDMTTIYTGDVWSFTVTPTTAWNPSPADGAAGQLPGQNLEWSPGNGAMNHQVYFGMDQMAVAAGDASVDQGVVADPEFNTGALRASTTYYWRVDENALGGSVNEGQVWSFTTFDGGPANKILYETWQGISGTAIADLTGDPNYPDNPTTSEYVDRMASPVDWADNYGQRLWGWLKPPETGDYTFWIAGDDYQELWLSLNENPADAELIADVPGWTPAEDWDNTGGGSSNAANQVSDPMPLVAGQKYFIMALGKEQGGGDSTAVAWQGPGVPARVVISADYVDMFALPPLTAFGPTPSNGAVDVFQSPILTWNAGENATQHAVYFGDDPDAVAAADESSPLYKGTQSATSYSPGALEWDKTFAWRIDELAGGETVRGPVWTFTTANFIPIDDFETYTNEVGNRLFQFWIDGLGFTDPPPGNPGNGSAAFVGHDIWTPGTPYMQIVETSTVQNGNQSMPLYVNNSTSPFYSETDHTFAQAIDMTSNGVTDLSLWVHGAPIRFAETAPGSVTMSASGTDIWDVADEFRFAYKRLNGNGSMTARVDSLDNTNVWAKAGVMIRETLDAGSPHAMCVVTPGSGTSFQRRLFTNDISENTDVTGIAPPSCVKITRTGNVFTAQYSVDGVVWNDFTNADGTVLEVTVTMVSSVYIGLAVTSHNAGATTVATFSEITSTGATGQWQVEDVGVAQPGNTPDQLYVGLASGASPAVVDMGEGPVLSDEWVQVKIPLADFAAGGANLGSVRQMIIGVGDRNNPVATGDGLVFIDNIRVLKPEPEPVAE